MSFKGITPPGQMYGIDQQTRVVLEDVFRQTDEIPKDIENVKSYIDDVKNELNARLDEILSAIDGWKTVLYPDEDEYILNNSSGERKIKSSGYKAGHDSGNIPVSDGTVNTDLNADKVDGYSVDDTGVTGDDDEIVCWDKANSTLKTFGLFVGNGNGDVPVSNGTVCTDLNADQVDGYDLDATGAADGELLAFDVSNGKLVTANKLVTDFLSKPTILGSEQTLVNVAAATADASYNFLLGTQDSTTADVTDYARFYIVKITLTAVYNGSTSNSVAWDFIAGTVTSTSDAPLATLAPSGGVDKTKTFVLLLPHGRYQINMDLTAPTKATTIVKAKEINLGFNYADI